ncbi:uncharacterized protein Tco025E_09240, partial [Trypanosoma conorhini]
RPVGDEADASAPAGNAHRFVRPPALYAFLLLFLLRGSIVTDAAATGPADVKHSVGLGPSSSRAPRLFGHAQLPPMHLATAKSVGDTCHGTGAVLGERIFYVSVQRLAPQPAGRSCANALGRPQRCDWGSGATRRLRHGLTSFFFGGGNLKTNRLPARTAPASG